VSSAVSRAGAAAICAVALLAGFIAGRVTGSGRAGSVTVQKTVERSTVVLAQHLRSATDPRDPGPLDLARAESVRRGSELETTIVTHRPWRDSAIQSHRVALSLLYDSNDDGKADRRDVIGYFHRRLEGWISSYGQGAQFAPVTRRSATTIRVARDASILFNAPGEAPLLGSSPIGVAVVARWKHGSDRLPDHGWVTVPAP
jgi:hypothetical protein